MKTAVARPLPKDGFPPRRGIEGSASSGAAGYCGCENEERPTLMLLDDREKQRGNANRATLAVARNTSDPIRDEVVQYRSHFLAAISWARLLLGQLQS